MKQNTNEDNHERENQEQILIFFSTKNSKRAKQNDTLIIFRKKSDFTFKILEKFGGKKRFFSNY